MPRYLVVRTKKYEAVVDAEDKGDAREEALDLSAKEWKLVEDRVEVRGLATATQADIEECDA